MVKVKIIKLGKIGIGQILPVKTTFYLNFLRRIFCHKDKLALFEISIKFLIFYTLYTYSKEKRIYLLEGDYPNFGHKNRFLGKTAQTKENVFLT